MGTRYISTSHIYIKYKFWNFFLNILPVLMKPSRQMVGMDKGQITYRINAECGVNLPLDTSGII